MTEFTVHLANRPGMLARLTEEIAGHGINIEALAAFGVADQGVVHLMVDDAATTRAALKDAALTFTEREVLTTMLPHEPGAVAAMAHRLAAADVNIEAMYLLRSSAEGLEFAVAVDQPVTARELAAS